MDERVVVSIAVIGMMKEALADSKHEQTWGDQITESLGLTDSEVTNDTIGSFIPYIAAVHGIKPPPDNVALAMFHAFNEGARLRTAIDNAKKETAA